MGAAPRPRARRASAGRGQHSLSPRVAAELVDRFEIHGDDLVVEIGAGSGRLTRALAGVAGIVLAIEVDDRLTARLIHVASAWPNVYVHEGDAVRAAFPTVPFRVVGNIPFAITTPLLRRIVDDPRARRLDVIVQYEAAAKRARPRGSVLSVLWHVGWGFELRERIPARAFHPSPAVDGAWLAGTRRPTPLIRSDEMPAFEQLVRRGFAGSGSSIGRSLGLPAAVFRRAGVPVEGRAVDLDVEDWVSLFRSSGDRSLRQRGRGSR